MIKKLRYVLLFFIMGILLVLVAPKVVFQKYWVGDYQILIDKNLKTVSIYGYRGDEEVVIPTEIGPFKVRFIYDDTFKGNKEIRSVYIPADYDSILSLIDCTNLQKIEFEEGTRVANVCVSGCPSLEEVIIHEGVEEIRGWYHGCTMLGDISFPRTLKNAGHCDFDYSNLYDLHKNDKYYVVGDGVLLFFNGDYNQDIVIPSGVKSFSFYEYLDNENISRKVYIPDTMVSLCIQVFEEDTIYFGDGEIENLDLNCLSEGVNGTIVAPANSYIEQYCKEKGYNFRVMTEEEEKEWREKTEAAASEITYQEN